MMLVLLVLATAAAAGQLTASVLPQAFADTYGAKCLDGTPPAYFISPPSSQPEKFVLFLEGGGWCSDVTPEGTIVQCAGRATGGLGSSNGNR